MMGTRKTKSNKDFRKTKRRSLKKKRNTRLRGGNDSKFEFDVNEEFKKIINSMNKISNLDVDKLFNLMEQPRFDINIEANFGYTALMAASKFGYTTFAKLLLDKKADINITDKIGTTALIFASDYGHTEIVQMLLEAGARSEAGAKVNLRNHIWAQTALHRASHKGHIKIVELLLAHGADVNLKDAFGTTALGWASKEGHTEIETILTAKKNANKTIEQIQNKSSPIPSLRTSAERQLRSGEIQIVNEWERRPPSKLGGKKRRTRKTRKNKRKGK